MPQQTQNPHKPREPLLLSTPVGLNSLGAEFDPHAPFSACRLCGALYQTDRDRQCKNYVISGLIYDVDGRWFGPAYAIDILDKCTARRNRWRELHERRYHSLSEIEAFAKTGHALTPEAAHRLAPYGIAPLLTDSQEDALSSEIEHAMHTAPRKPSDDAEY